MTEKARFPGFAEKAGGYESFYLRAVDPSSARSVWLRHTVHASPGHPATGSIWLTLFGGAGPAALKESSPDPQPSPWVTIRGSAFGPDGVRGSLERDGRRGEYELRFENAEPELRHLPSGWMYRAPIPRTKLVTPQPGARISGRVTLDDRTYELDRWPGMVGHNWGAEHAERWIWLHGVRFDDAPDAWLDVALGRIKIGGRTTPWVANGMLSLDGERIRFGGLLRRGTSVSETPDRLELRLAGAGGARLSGTVSSPRDQIVVFRYADPDRSEHHTANCSIAALDLTLERDGTTRRLRSSHGGAYELGMRETTHGLQVQPFPDP